MRRETRKEIKTYSPMIKSNKDNYDNNKSLQAVRKKTRRVSLCFFPERKHGNSWNPGSVRKFFEFSNSRRFYKPRAVLTVEAAFIIPLFLLAVWTVLGMMDLYRVQAMVKTSLHQSAEELGMYAYAASKNGDPGNSTPVDLLSSGACAVYAKNQLPDFGEYISVSMIGSRYEDHRVELRATVTYQLPFSLLPIPRIQVSNSSMVAAWTGYDPDRNSGKEEEGEEMVYVSEYESVYHTSAHCTHLDLSVHQGNKEQMENKRNQYGKKYHACEKCKGDGSQVYYTEKGDRYHSQASCSGLKRTVRLVEKSLVHAKSQCERCRESGS